MTFVRALLMVLNFYIFKITGLGYALLANVPAIVGIYMAVFPVIPYIFLGTSRHNSMGKSHCCSLLIELTVKTRFSRNLCCDIPAGWTSRDSIRQQPRIYVHHELRKRHLGRN